MISNFLAALVDFVWGTPLVILLIGGGSYLLFVSRFLPLKGFLKAFQLICSKPDKNAPGQISHFQALCNALAATVGLGNIAGVAVAISQGGAGAIFWMWVAALIGMNTKFFECTLSVMYRGKDHNGEVQGGPMYVIENALPKSFRFLAFFFAICGLIGTMALFQVNQLAAYVHEEYSVAPLVVGVLSALFVGYILIGGIKRLARVTSYLVPLMCLFYILCGVVILFLNAEKIPGLFTLIFKEAFTGQAVVGGAMGLGVLEVLKIGVKRAAFSNEAGVGTAPMAHGNAQTSEPVSEGLVAMLGPFFDTIIVCTITALVILSSLPQEALSESSGVLLTTSAFEASLPGFGKHFLGFAILLFSVTTMIGMANYNNKCWNYLFKGRKGFGEKTFIFVFCMTLVIGAIGAQDDVVNLLDSGYALMAFPNMIATLWLAGRVRKEAKSYFARH